MRFTIPAGALAAAAKAASRVTRHNPFSTYGERLSADGTTLTLTATDLQTTLTRTVPCFVESPGHAGVDAAGLAEAVAAHRADADLDLAIDESGLHLRLGRSQMDLLTIDLDNAPHHLDLGTDPLTIDQETLRYLLVTGGYSSSTDLTRVRICGVHLRAVDNNLRAESTDTHRAAYCIQPGEADNGLTAILPNDFVKVLLSLLTTGPAEVCLTPDKCIVRVGDTLLSSRLIEGEFVNMKKAMPDRGDYYITATVDRDALLAGCRLAGVTAREDNRKIVLNLSGEEILITSASSKIGRASVPVPATFSRVGRFAESDCPQLLLGVRDEYLRDAVAHLPAGDLFLTATGELHPILIESAVNLDSKHVIMPMTV